MLTRAQIQAKTLMCKVQLNLKSAAIPGAVVLSAILADHRAAVFVPPAHEIMYTYYPELSSEMARPRAPRSVAAAAAAARQACALRCPSPPRAVE